MMMNNLFQLPHPLPNTEQFESLHQSENLLIERIISTGKTTPEGQWYDQEQDEWVVLLQGKAQLMYEDNSIVHLCPGDWVFIPAHQRHRVSYTSSEPPCIWLAIHGLLS